MRRHAFDPLLLLDYHVVLAFTPVVCLFEDLYRVLWKDERPYLDIVDVLRIIGHLPLLHLDDLVVELPLRIVRRAFQIIRMLAEERL